MFMKPTTGRSNLFTRTSMKRIRKSSAESHWKPLPNDVAPTALDLESVPRTDTSQPRVYLEKVYRPKGINRTTLRLWATVPIPAPDLPALQTQTLLTWSANADGSGVTIAFREKGSSQGTFRRLVNSASEPIHLPASLQMWSAACTLTEARRERVEAVLEGDQHSIYSDYRRPHSVQSPEIPSYGSGGSRLSRRGSLESCAGSCDSGVSHPPGKKKKQKKKVKAESLDNVAGQDDMPNKTQVAAAKDWDWSTF